jgi:uncharacterized protein YprB with RNaseH-like and TPR domain
MQLDAQTYLRLVESAGTICFWDLEATGLKGDYNSVLCLSVKPIGKKPTTFKVERPGRDKKVVSDARDLLSTFDCWVTYYGKGFDFLMVNTRLLEWGLTPLLKKPHIDMYYTLKSNLNTSRRSQAHLLDWLGTKQRKMSVSAEQWNRVLSDPVNHMPQMVKRCESDTEGLEALYMRTRHLVKDIR